MAFSVSPSVIVREVDASASVPAIATPPAAMAGVFRWGPVGEVVLVSSENELVSRFGTPSADNYETFFVGADYLSYANALYVARVDNGAATASSTDIQKYANNDINPNFTTYGAFDALYPGKLGNSLEIAYVKGNSFTNEEITVGEIPATRISGNTVQQATSQTVDFNSASVAFEVLPSNEITTIESGDIITIGNDSVGYQEIVVNTVTKESRDSVGDPTANTVLTTAIHHTLALGGKYLLAETSLTKLTITRKWAYGNLFGKAPAAANYHIAVLDRDGEISGTAGSVLELYSDVSVSPTAKLPSGKTNYYKEAIEQESSWVKVANTVHFEASAQASTYERLGTGYGSFR